jgi:hypothetical protein
MSKQKFFDSGEEWQKFRESQAERFGMAPGTFAVFFKTYPLSVRDRDYEGVYGQTLTGKPEIAAFMGITVKTLETWRKINKYPDMPIQWGTPASLAETDLLLYWKTNTEISKMSEGLKRSAIAYLMGTSVETLRNGFLPVSKRTFYKSRYSKSAILDAAHILMERRTLKHQIEGLFDE